MIKVHTVKISVGDNYFTNWFFENEDIAEEELDRLNDLENIEYRLKLIEYCQKNIKKLEEDIEYHKEELVELGYKGEI